MDMASAMQELHTHPLGAVLSHSHICVSQDPDQKDQPQSFIPRHAIFGYRVAKLVGGFNPSGKIVNVKDYPIYYAKIKTCSKSPTSIT